MTIREAAIKVLVLGSQDRADEVGQVSDAVLIIQGIDVAPPDPVPMRLTCPDCGELHIDEGEFATKSHHTHSCQFCGLTWRPAVVPTVGVRFLPGFRDESK